MAVPKVRIYIRVSLSDGSRPYLDPVQHSNGSLKKGWAIYQGQPQSFAEYSYYLRYLRGDTRVWESVGEDPALALTAKRRTVVRLSAVAEGMALQGAEPIRRNSENEAERDPGRSLRECIGEYLAETRDHKSSRTLAAYTATLGTFRESLGKRADLITVEDVSRADALTYAKFLRTRGNSPRTVRNRIDYLQIFLHHHGLPSVLVGKDKPKFTDKKVRTYSQYELGLLLGYASVDEADLLHFLLGTGTREQEAQFACWSDLDLHAKTYTVTEHLDLGFLPKDREEGVVPLHDALVERLIARRQRYPRSRLIFPGPSGEPNGHLLRIIKSLALRAGVNCGHCVNRAALSCAEHPVCRHIILHALRKTYATVLHRGGISARTIMGYLRHSNLETTLRYLADGDDEQTREKIGAAFAGIIGGTR